MSFLKTTGTIESVKDILMLNRDAALALLNLHAAVLRQESEFSIAERELIAAYVSGINNCQYCHGVHSETAKAFGVEPELLESLLEDLDTALIEDRFKPVFLYARQLTTEPGKTRQEQVDAIISAGWSDRAVHDLVQVVSLFNLMNRLVEGHGVKGTSTLFKERARALKTHGYGELIRLLEESC